MGFWSDWSDGKKWIMGIVAALLIAAILGVVNMLTGDDEGITRQEIPILAKSHPDFAIQSEMRGTAIAEGREIRIVLNEARVWYPQAVGDLEQRYIHGVRVALTKPDLTQDSWLPLANSPFYLISETLSAGEEIRLGIQHMQIPLDNITSVAAGELVFEFYEGYPDDPNGQGTSSAFSSTFTF